MLLDRRTTHELVQALLRARNKKDGNGVLENVAQTSPASGQGSYAAPALGEARVSSASQPGVMTGEKAANQSPELMLTPRPHPFDDPARYLYTGKVADMGKARGSSAHDELGFKIAPNTLSSLPNPQASYGRPLEVGGVYSTKHKPSGGDPGKALRLDRYPTIRVLRGRPVPFATQIDLGGREAYQSQRDTRKAFNDPRVDIDTSHRRPWGPNGATMVASPEQRPASLPLAGGEAAREVRPEKKMPKIRYVTSGEVWSEFLGGIGKGIVQTLADIAFEDAKHRQAMVDGIYIDTPNPDIFGPPKSAWEYEGKSIAPGVMVVVRPLPLKPRTWNGKIIGRVTPPKDLKPGTVLFGNYMHEKIAEFLKASYPKTKFDVRVKRGQKGVDVRYEDDLYPGFKYLDIKPNKPHSQKELNRQIYKWGYEEPTVRAISYDEYGNIYDGFGH